MNMREKIARALLAKDYPDDVGGEMEDFWWDRHGDRYLDMADAVLDALLEPTEGMVDAGWAGPDWGYVSSGTLDGGPVHCWTVMIRAAKEGK